ncbi:hypothetical protein VCHC39A1_1369, partial [Vibrio cholerae HC-39A1]
MARLADSGV